MPMFDATVCRVIKSFRTVRVEAQTAAESQELAKKAMDVGDAAWADSPAYAMLEAVDSHPVEDE